jgi:hypothetical protein
MDRGDQRQRMEARIRPAAFKHPDTPLLETAGRKFGSAAGDDRFRTTALILE